MQISIEKAQKIIYFQRMTLGQNYRRVIATIPDKVNSRTAHTRKAKSVSVDGTEKVPPLTSSIENDGVAVLLFCSLVSKEE